MKKPKKKLKESQKQPSKAVVKIKIRGQDDIIIERIVQEYEEQVEGNEEIAMLRDNYF